MASVFEFSQVPHATHNVITFLKFLFMKLPHWGLYNTKWRKEFSGFGRVSKMIFNFDGH